MNDNKNNPSCEIFQSVIARKSTNQVVILQTFRLGEARHQSYICMVSLDYISQSQEDLDRLVQVHKVKSDDSTADFNFIPNRIILNH